MNAECQVHQRPARSLCSTHARADGEKAGLTQLPLQSVTCHLELLRKTLKHTAFDKGRNYTLTYIPIRKKLNMDFPMSKNIQENKHLFPRLVLQFIQVWRKERFTVNHH